VSAHAQAEGARAPSAQELQARGALLVRVQEQYGVAAGAAGRGGDGLAAGPPLPMAEALAVIVANERGRQGRASFNALRAARAARLRNQRRAASGAARALVHGRGSWPPVCCAGSAGRDASRAGAAWSMAGA